MNKDEIIGEVESFLFSDNLIFPEKLMEELYKILDKQFQNKEQMVKAMNVELSRYKVMDECSK